MLSKKEQKRIRRHKKIRSTISGTAERPRVSVFRSNTGLYVQVIDDVKGHTMFSVSTKGLKGTKMEQSKEAGKILAKKVVDGGIKKIVFDRGGYRYTGRVKALAEGLREGGLEF